TVKLLHGATGRRSVRWGEYTKTFRRKIAIAYNPQGQPEAIIVYSTKGYGEGHEWVETGELIIGEMHWSTLEGRDALLSFIYGHADQIKNVRIILSPRDDDYYQWLDGIHTPTYSTTIMHMARIVDVEGALSGIPVSTSGEINIEIVDDQLKWNNGIFNMREHHGTLCVEHTSNPSTLRMSIQGLTSILYGTLNQNQLRRMGWIYGDSSTLISNWFPNATPYLMESF
ncbi:MAG: enhanced intracellular survival protein Eis, partial [Candidatus Thorarchaeota archaeon]